MFPEDLKIYRIFRRRGQEAPAMPTPAIRISNTPIWNRAGRACAACADAPREPQPPRGSPIFGHSPDFDYLYYGAVWYGDELWNGGRLKDYVARDGRVTPLEQLRFIDEELGGRYFTPWRKFNHPQLGEVEIGGFNSKFWSQNPPPELLEEWAKKEALFNLFLWKSLPRVKVAGGALKPVRKAKDTYELTVTLVNEGYLPTALKMADRVKMVRPDNVTVALPDGIALSEAGPVRRSPISRAAKKWTSAGR